MLRWRFWNIIVPLCCTFWIQRMFNVYFIFVVTDFLTSMNSELREEKTKNKNRSKVEKKSFCWWSLDHCRLAVCCRTWLHIECWRLSPVTLYSHFCSIDNKFRFDGCFYFFSLTFLLFNICRHSVTGHSKSSFLRYYYFNFIIFRFSEWFESFVNLKWYHVLWCPFVDRFKLVFLWLISGKPMEKSKRKKNPRAIIMCNGIRFVVC